ncbi:hypothetical protein THAOC_14588 [Thalassiosira oceanica]|uniref:Uncharacterized protein n=1 Tax=Thalassiosira oceanica TaxID=159749 RepID=K0SUJ6_THAOC|nr:hypothetical protein THAOC_14588 [Thalassiosira oceanica]|eukprot:EJK64656.1 hypothetical protein THAOC_14588 [Thalassiosira oceanica]
MWWQCRCTTASEISSLYSATLGFVTSWWREIEAHYDAATHVCNQAIDTHERGEVQLRSEFAEQPLAGTNNNYQVAIRQVPQRRDASDGNRSCNHCLALYFGDKMDNSPIYPTMGQPVRQLVPKTGQVGIEAGGECKFIPFENKGASN